MIKLDPRLQAAADLVLPGLPVADIGTDHAYLPVYLVERGICPYAVATDKAAAPVEAAAATTQAQGVGDRVDLRCGDGLGTLAPGEAATLVFCGMGGQLILDILEAGAPVLAQARRLVLQPQRHLTEVRRWLAGHTWRIIGETLVESKGFFYVVIAAEPGEMALNDQQAEFGPCLLEQKGPVFRAWLARQLREKEVVCRALRDQTGENAAQRLTVLEEEIRRIQRLVQ